MADASLATGMWGKENMPSSRSYNCRGFSYVSGRTSGTLIGREDRDVVLKIFLDEDGRPSLLGWRPSLLAWRPSLLGWRPAIASRVEAIAIRVEAIAIRVWRPSR